MQAEEGVDGHHRPVASECEPPAGTRDRSPRPAARSALGSEIRGPDLAEIPDGLGVLWLHARDHPQLSEAADVGRRRRLDVLDPMPAPGIAIYERIESVPDGAIADGMDLHLPASRARRFHRLR